MSKLKPITNDEFLRFLTRCRPPTAFYNSTVAVANSGGPDSICLLFLLNQALSHNKDLFKSLCSLTIDHALQKTSAQMAQHCERFTLHRNIPHRTYRIPWGTYPFRDTPAQDKAFEDVARRARYHFMFQGMTEFNSDIVALGHHADDQIETSLMRQARGSTELGAAGMRPCRRWGMGDPSKGLEHISYFGHQGMSRWIIRPLLPITKDRILATCDQHSLEYVTDPTNFQPAITVRNAIRQMINEKFGKTEYEQLQPPVAQIKIPAHILQQTKAAEEALDRMTSVETSATSGRDRLLSAMRRLSDQMEETERQATLELARRRIPSPISTFLLSVSDLPLSPAVQTAMILRICRYVSFRPWGSLQAQMNRRSTSITEMCDRILNASSSPKNDDRIPFTSGSGVLWVPVIVSKNKSKIVQANTTRKNEQGDSLAWLAKRLPPSHSQRGNDDVARLTKFITPILKAAISRDTDVENILYDNRFLIRFTIARIPPDIRALVLNDEEMWIKSYSQYVIPVVVTNAADGVGFDMLEQTLVLDVHPILGPFKVPTSTLHFNTPLLGSIKGSSMDLNKPFEQSVHARQIEPKTALPWIEITFIRTIDSI